MGPRGSAGSRRKSRHHGRLYYGSRTDDSLLRVLFMCLPSSVISKIIFSSFIIYLFAKNAYNTTCKKNK